MNPGFPCRINRKAIRFGPYLTGLTRKRRRKRLRQWRMEFDRHAEDVETLSLSLVKDPDTGITGTIHRYALKSTGKVYSRWEASYGAAL